MWASVMQSKGSTEHSLEINDCTNTMPTTRPGLTFWCAHIYSLDDNKAIGVVRFQLSNVPVTMLWNKWILYYYSLLSECNL